MLVILLLDWASVCRAFLALVLQCSLLVTCNKNNNKVLFPIRRPVFLPTATTTTTTTTTANYSPLLTALLSDNLTKCDGFKCRNNAKCIPVANVCNSFDDCGDMSDERLCPSSTLAPAGCNGFVCMNTLCIDKSYVCDSENDCGDMSDEAYCPVKSTTPQSAPYCGMTRPNPRVFGSGTTAIGEFPWIARIDTKYEDYKETVHCGGTLISEQWILTAAHCVAFIQDVYIERMTIYLGRHDLASENEKDLQTTYSQIVVHPQYNSTKNWDFDYALVKLDKPVAFNKRWRPICLPDWICDFSSNYTATKIDSCTDLIIAGWGTSESETRPTALRTGRLPIRSREICNRYFQTTLTDSQICAGRGESSACRGDSGGPVMCSVNNRMYLHGVISWGADGCGLLGFPSVFTRACIVLGWIRKTIAISN